MQDLYSRLRRCGFDAQFIKQTVLPDWWQDGMAAVPANRAIAEAAIARHLGFRVLDLRDPNGTLSLPPVTNFRLKRNKKTTPEEVRAGVMVAQRAGQLVAKALSSLVAFGACPTALQARQTILKAHDYVDLDSLTRFCWDIGVIVLYLDPERLPEGSKRFQGVAMFHESRPIIILGYGGDARPWLAFHLAHELGHICLGHVRVGDKPLVDSEITKVGDDDQDRQADEFATEVLTGQKTLKLTSRQDLSGPRLAEAVKKYGDEHAIAPGTAALIYARTRNQWPAAQLALKVLNETGAKQSLYRVLKERLDLRELPESTERFLTCLEPVTP